jgi:hypothetical protein
MDLGALLAFEKTIYPSSHLSTSSPTDQEESAHTTFMVM